MLLGIHAEAAGDVRLCFKLAKTQEGAAGALVQAGTCGQCQIRTSIAANCLGRGWRGCRIDPFLRSRLCQLGFDELRFGFDLRRLASKAIAIATLRLRLLLQIGGVNLHKGYAGSNSIVSIGNFVRCRCRG